MCVYNCIQVILSVLSKNTSFLIIFCLIFPTTYTKRRRKSRSCRPWRWSPWPARASAWRPLPWRPPTGAGEFFPSKNREKWVWNLMSVWNFTGEKKLSIKDGIFSGAFVFVVVVVVGCWLLVVGYCWLLVVGCWLLVVGCWLLVVGCWLLVVGW